MLWCACLGAMTVGHWLHGNPFEFFAGMVLFFAIIFLWIACSAAFNFLSVETVKPEPPPEIYENQKIVERYKDFAPLGKWVVRDCDSTEIVAEGDIFQETIKFIGRDGRMKLGKMHVVKGSEINGQDNWR